MGEFMARRLLGLSMVVQGLVIALTPFKPNWQMNAARRLVRAKSRATLNQTQRANALPKKKGF